ncbi:hypothetical protein THIOSC15_1820008 [uncultured Thiomicrorhabdus sp.]
MAKSDKKFDLVSSYSPNGDQPTAIVQLVEGLQCGEAYQTLLGVTGSGKTFTVANVIAKVQRPTIILAHNKTLAAQLYGEMKSFFPNNAVEYFVPDMTITSRKLMCPLRIPISPKIHRSMNRSSNCVFLRLRRCWNAKM